MRAAELQAVLERLARPRVLVIGDLILDRYVSGDVERISPEAPIPVLNARTTAEKLGGAGNVALNLRSMEAEVEMVGVVGQDGRGRMLSEMLAQSGVVTSGVLADPSRPTTEKTRMISGAQQVLRVDFEVSRPISDELATRILAELSARIARAGAVILSDYGKGVLTPKVLAGAIELARLHGVSVLVDPKGSDYTRYRGATLITPNRKEAEEALGRKLSDRSEWPRAAQDLIAIADLQAAVVTLGAQGMFLMNRSGESVHVPTFAREVFDVTGAGDTVISHLALYIAAGLDLPTAVHLANHAAGIVVAKPGAASVTRGELFERLDQHERGWRSNAKVVHGERLDAQLKLWRSQNKRIVFTNGCFDILHIGHVDYLRFARMQGDVLIVGVNDDASVRRLKGPTRPVNALEDRMAVLVALEMVDGVTSFAEDTPASIVERISPSVLVKGEDWRDRGVVGREWVEAHGGKVVLAPLVPGRSTTSTIERIERGQKGC
ncbi:MAG: D-glycero-beta-D-manno-heptose-7-phosphate kinase [Planctomycetes bacterium]|nr:D-glycero-beta-D-manno-heptose-7-phosphate kinase [Planctomycetota bacterium]